MDFLIFNTVVNFLHKIDSDYLVDSKCKTLHEHQGAEVTVYMERYKDEFYDIKNLKRIVMNYLDSHIAEQNVCETHNVESMTIEELADKIHQHLTDTLNRTMMVKIRETGKYSFLVGFPNV